MADSRNAAVNLTASNATLASQIKMLTEHNSKQKEEMETLKSNVADILSLIQDTNIHRNTKNNNRYQKTKTTITKIASEFSQEIIIVGPMVSLMVTTIPVVTAWNTSQDTKIM
eukprot:8348020-Ditylum_brightwellii.AAC.1